MLEYGTNIVAGVTPGKGGLSALDGAIPVYNSVEEAKEATDANVSIIFVPPAFAAEAIIEASFAGIEFIVCITEGIPVQDMVEVKKIIDLNGTRLLGPNCPGVITVDECKLGIMPGFITKKGSVGVVSKSGTLTYEAIDQLVKAGLGQTTAIGIGGDPIIGTDMKTILQLFENDPETDAVVLIGEIGGQMEIEAARWVKDNMSKPVVGFIAGQTAPPGRRMGHAGAIVSGGDDTAEAKMRILKECGISVCESVAEIGAKTKLALNNK
jgi:succinyl-CoA synthetase alpha subunit